jgi:hypothetical protein
LINDGFLPKATEEARTRNISVQNLQISMF